MHPESAGGREKPLTQDLQSDVGGGDFAAPAPTEVTFEDVDDPPSGTFEVKVGQITVQHA